MNRRKQSSLQSSTRSYLLAAFALTMLLGFPTGTQAQWTTNGNDINNTNSGKVGIGTSAPSAKLEVEIANAVGDGIKVTDAGAAGKYVYMGDGSSTSGIFAPYIAGVGGTAWGLILEGGVSSDTANIPAVSVRGNIGYSNLVNSPIFTVAKSSGIELFRVGATGNVGIGTATPGGRLQVAGDTYVGSNDGSIPYAVSLGASGNGYGSVGYGMKFSVTSNAYTYTASDYASMLQFHAGGFKFRTAPLGTAGNYITFNDILTVLNDGSVGIGTATPSTKLHVVGDVTVTGNIAAKYQDVAEWVPSRQKLTAGTVVILDTEQSNHVMASVSAYDTRVAGVVSAQPGVLLGEAGENKAMIATTGRVKVKVDATRSPIRVGDLLVTSGEQGVAMKSEPLDLGGTPIHRPGTLIGKALEPLEKGKGEILVLLSLQ